MDNEYYILDNGERIGPFTAHELMDRPLEPGDIVLMPSQTQGVPAHSLPEFEDYFRLEGIFYPTIVNTKAWYLRLPAFIIDYLIVVIGLVIVGLIFFPQVLLKLQPDPNDAMNYQKIADNMAKHQTEYIIAHLITFVIIVLYHATCESSSLRASIGKYVFGLAVVDELGYSLTFWHSIKRNSGKITYELLSMVFSIFGYFPLLRMGWSERHQAMHDVITGCFIVKKNA